jgi:hypothetical protein
MKNEGTIDRVLRVLGGLALLIGAWFFLGLAEGSMLGLVAAIVAAVLIGTGAAGICPAYCLFGIRTCPVRPAQR